MHSGELASLPIFNLHFSKNKGLTSPACLHTKIIHYEVLEI